MAATYFGIDCAQWQGTIDWGKVKKDGVKFAILKVTQKDNAVEKAFERNYAGCAKQGIPVGVYRYVYAKTAAAATAEAKAIVSVLKGRKAPCGVWLDMEDASIRKLGKSALTAVIAAERKVLEAAGYQVGVYCNQDWYSNVLDVDRLDLPFWIARYGTNNGKQQTKPSVKSRHTLWGWQYSSVGRVSGISGSVDVNVAYFAPGRSAAARSIPAPWCGRGTGAKLFQDAIVARAKEIAEYMVKHKWRYKGGGYVAKSTYAATKKLDKPGCSCAHFVSWVLQDVGLLKPGKVLSHSKAGYGTGAKSIVNADQLIGCTVTYPNERIADYKGKLKPGDVLVHDSSIGIYDPIGGTPAILTAREGQPINGKKQYTDLLVSSGYEWKRDVLAVVRAKVQMARCRTMPNDLH